MSDDLSIRAVAGMHEGVRGAHWGTLGHTGAHKADYPERYGALDLDALLRAAAFLFSCSLNYLASDTSRGRFRKETSPICLFSQDCIYGILGLALVRFLMVISIWESEVPRYRERGYCESLSRLI